MRCSFLRYNKDVFFFFFSLLWTSENNLSNFRSTLVDFFVDLGTYPKIKEKDQIGI